jgi:hypothetical protein
MKCPQTLARINAALHELRDAGLSTKIVDVHGVALRDDQHGPFLRLTFVMDDGGTLELDTLEASELLRTTQVH